MNRCMFRYSFLVSLAMVQLSIVSSQGFKNTNRLVENSSPSAQPDVNLLTSAYKYLEKNKRRYHLSDLRSQLRYVGFTVDDLSRSHLPLQQMHNNVRVWGGELRVHFSQDAQVYNVSGAILHPIDIANHSPGINSEQAKELALQAAVKSNP